MGMSPVSYSNQVPNIPANGLSRPTSLTHTPEAQAIRRQVFNQVTGLLKENGPQKVNQRIIGRLQEDLPMGNWGYHGPPNGLQIDVQVHDNPSQNEYKMTLSYELPGQAGQKKTMAFSSGESLTDKKITITQTDGTHTQAPVKGRNKI